ncbi:hypothetical protein OPQ81_003145 [Rhizoctonia solani]|nr:hypothetical protein OPQ81_003145 [Rhizoctonia solani]
MATGNADERMIEKNLDKTRCMVVIYAMSTHNMNASQPCPFRTYPLMLTPCRTVGFGRHYEPALLTQVYSKGSRYWTPT